MCVNTSMYYNKKWGIITEYFQMEKPTGVLIFISLHLGTGSWVWDTSVRRRGAMPFAPLCGSFGKSHRNRQKACKYLLSSFLACVNMVWCTWTQKAFKCLLSSLVPLCHHGKSWQWTLNAFCAHLFYKLNEPPQNPDQFIGGSWTCAILQTTSVWHEYIL